MSAEKIPAELRALNQWVLWKFVTKKPGDEPSKVPFQVDGKTASASDPATWNSFEAVLNAYMSGGYEGIGFEFAKDGGYCGVDLDGCRNPETGIVSDWAREIIATLATYSEVSPSGTGIKMFLRGKSPFSKGRKKNVDFPAINGKSPAIEIYDWGRYFAVTGLRVSGLSEVCEPRQNELEEIASLYFPDEPAIVPGAPPPDFRSVSAVIDRARRYVSKMPPAISKQGGHNQTFRVACVLVLGFELTQDEAMAVLSEYNLRCQPPWSERELLHKVQSASQQPGERGYLRNTSPERWLSIPIPTYKSPPPTLEHQPRETTLLDAMKSYKEKIKTGNNGLITLGISELDYALEGGVEKGEMIILAARPSHGKSAVGLQCIHHWTSEGRPCVIVSEEMAALALGKRSIQFVSDIPQEHWFDLLPHLESQIEHYGATHAKTIVLEGCGTADAAKQAIERAVQQHGVECVVVDYAQLLGSPGKDRYHQMTTMSLTLRQIASSQKIVLMALCQMSRDIESRNSFNPQLSDIKETGQLEQDADVIIFLCWPHKLDINEPVNKYQFFVRKNRNRGINASVVTCRFLPSRQQIVESKPEYYHEKPEFSSGY